MPIARCFFFILFFCLFFCHVTHILIFRKKKLQNFEKYEQSRYFFWFFFKKFCKKWKKKKKIAKVCRSPYTHKFLFLSFFLHTLQRYGISLQKNDKIWSNFQKIKKKSFFREKGSKIMTHSKHFASKLPHFASFCVSLSLTKSPKNRGKKHMPLSRPLFFTFFEKKNFFFLEIFFIGRTPTF